MDANECRTLRERLGWTQTEFGEAVGVGRVTVTRWETGVQRITEPMARLIQRVVHDEIAKRKKTKRRPKR